MAIPLSRPVFTEQTRQKILQGIDGILESGNFMPGAFAGKLEGGFAELCGTSHAVTVNTCSTALLICLKYFDVAGKDVLVASGSFLTDVTAVMDCGGNPILVDMDPATLTFGVKELEAKLTPNTSGIIWVHVTGFISPDYQAILDFAKAHDLFILEDAAHAPGARVDDRVAGSLGDAGVFSFYPPKNVTSGTGGLIATDDPELARFAKEMRRFGMDIETGEIKYVASDWFMDEIRACVGYHSYEELAGQHRRRLEIAARYYGAFRNQPGLTLLDVPEGNVPAWYQFPVFLDPRIDRDAVSKALKETHGIASKRIWSPTHLEAPLRRFDLGDLKMTEETFGQSLCIPMYPGLTDEQADEVAAAVVEEVRARL